MGKPKMIGMFKPYTPNSRVERKRMKPFGKKKTVAKSHR